MDILKSGFQSFFMGLISRKKFLGLRLSAILEVIVFLAVLVVLDLLFGNGERFFFVSPHPFWIIVLMASLQYGTNEGVLASILATVTLFSGKIPEQTVLQDHFEHIVFLIKNPILWFISSVFIGEARMRQIRERDKLRLDLAQADEREKVISESYEGLKNTKERIEATLAGEMVSVIEAYKQIQTLNALPFNEVFPNALKLILLVLGPKKFSVFQNNQGLYHLVASEGWEKEDPFKTEFNDKDPMIEALKGSPRPLSIVRTEDRTALKDEGVLVAGVKAPQSQDLLGFIKIEKIPLIRLKSTTEYIFALIGQWIANAYTKPTVEQVQKQNSFPYDPIIALAKQLSFCVFEYTLLIQSNGDNPPFNEVDQTITDFLRVQKIIFADVKQEQKISYVILNLPKSRAGSLHQQLLQVLTSHQWAKQFQIELNTLYETN